MVNSGGLTRLGMFAVGLGIGAAVVSAPGIASADDLDIQISIDGHDLFSTTDNSATATSGTDDIAIAFGNGADADATLGAGDFAVADGSDSKAEAADGNDNFASVFGDNGFAQAGISGNDDVATVFDPTATSSSPGSSAFAILGNDNLASVVGDDDYGRAGGVSVGVLGSNDITSIFGTGSDAYSGASATVPGDFDLAAVFGDGFNAHTALGGDYLFDILPSL
jgi:hypothetical protein